MIAPPEASPAGGARVSVGEGPSVKGGGSAAEVFRVFLGLGLTSFGGPVAHLGYFREAVVVRRPVGSRGGSGVRPASAGGPLARPGLLRASLPPAAG